MKRHNASGIVGTVLMALIYAGCGKGGNPGSNGTNGGTNTPTISVAPTVTTSTATSVTISTATFNGTLNAVGDNSATISCGAVWGTAHAPTVGSRLVTATSVQGAGSFSVPVSGLSGGTTYYIRAFATNTVGTAYGSEISFTTLPSTVAIGQFYAGGIIFYVDATRAHGLAMATFDLPLAETWAPSNASTAFIAGVSTGTSFGTGKANTAAIINAFGTAGTYAALDATKLSLNGYSDWYLPSRDEMSLIAQNLYSVNASLTASELLYSFGYWTSSNAGNGAAQVWALTSNSIVNTELAGTGYLVRPIRAF